MRKALAASVAAISLAAAGCGHGGGSPGETVDRNYNVGAFDKIDLAGAYDATVRTGPAPSVHARGGENILDNLTIEVRDGKLVIEPKHHGFMGGFHWGWNNNGKVQLTITVPQLHAATLAGSGSIGIDRVAGDNFEGTVAGSGEMNVGAIEVQSLKLSIAGSGSAKTGAGKAQSGDYNIAGSGDLDVGQVQTQDIKVTIAGAGSVKANASQTAKVDIMGSGDVTVTGGAKCSVSKAGSGDVHCS
jgi:Putative auto-transporter adhesin, head GIN domain